MGAVKSPTAKEGDRLSHGVAQQIKGRRYDREVEGATSGAGMQPTAGHPFLRYLRTGGSFQLYSPDGVSSGSIFISV